MVMDHGEAEHHGRRVWYNRNAHLIAARKQRQTNRKWAVARYTLQRHIPCDLLSPVLTPYCPFNMNSSMY
jgi:hypothetical protein